MRHIFLLLCLVVLMSACSERADVVLKNGVIYAVDKDFSTQQGVAILGDKIIAVGSNADMEKMIGSNTNVIDLKGKTVVPGFIDSHYHFMGVGKKNFYLNLDGTTSLDDFLARVKDAVAEKKEGEWITGRGWIEEDWPGKKFPSKRDLDKVAPKNPVMLRRADGHAAVVNSLALKIAGISKSTANPVGGEILRNRYGNATGMLIDNAMDLMSKYLPADDDEATMRKFALKAQAVATAYGITQVHDMGSGWHTVDLWKKMYQDGDLKIRIISYIMGPGDDANKLLEHGTELGLFNHRLSVIGIKIVEDGALGSRGAALLEPYSDAATSGLLMYKDSEIFSTILRATQNHVQMAIHAIGDKANRDVLNLYARALNELNIKPEDVHPRFRMEHSQIVSLEDIPRFRQLNVIPSMQPSHAIGDLHFAIRRLGMERIAEGYAWRKFLDQGNFIPAGSDAPVEEGNPMIEFYAASVRKDTTGFSAEGWHPEYRMTREEALKALTIWGSRAVDEENIKGSIEPGKLADLVVLDRNLMTDPEDRLFDIKVLMTMIGGEIVYQKGKD